MAKFDGKFIRGAVGKTTFRKLGNKQIIQGKTDKEQISMTPATIKASYIFGRASTLASYIRDSVFQIVRSYYDSKMISRFTGQCNQIIQQAATDKDEVFHFNQDQFTRLNGFEFNMDSPVKKYIFTQPLVDLTEQKVTINVPEIQIPKDLKFPTDIWHCTLAFNVSLFDLTHNQYRTQEVQSIEIEHKVAPSTIPAQQFSFEGSPGTLAIITLGLYYSEKTFAGKAITNNKKFSPAAILKAEFCPGEIVKQEHWQEMQFNEKKKRKKQSKPKKKVDKAA